MAIRRIQFRRGTAADWTSANTILAAGEPGVETDTGRFKVGTGPAPWNSLPSAIRSGGGDTITASDATVIPLVVKGAASQTANLLEARDSAGAVKTHVTPLGSVVTSEHVLSANLVQAGSTVANGAQQMFVTPLLADRRGLVVRGAASQTANLAEFQNSAGTVLAHIRSDGQIRGDRGSIIVGDGTAGEALYVGPGAATQRGLRIIGVASQTANLAEFQDSAGTALLRVFSDGGLYIGSHAEGRFTIQPSSAASKAMVVRGAASQTANLVEFQNSAGTVLAAVSPAGLLYATDNSLFRALQFGAADSGGTGRRLVTVAN